MHTAYTVCMVRRCGSSLGSLCQVGPPGMRLLCSERIPQQGGQGMQLCLAAAVVQSRQLLLEPFRATQGGQVHLEPATLHNPVDTGPNDKWPQL